MFADSPIEAMLRKLSALNAEVSNEGIDAPQLSRVATVLSQFRTQAQPPAQIEPQIDIVQPGTPSVVLPPGLQPRWEAFDEFLAALNEQFGHANNDQYIQIAMIAATLAIGGTPASVTATWPTFIDYLTKLTSDLLGDLNNDQYLTALSIAARLATGAGTGGGGGAFPEAPTTGDLYMRNGLLGAWQLLTLIDGGVY